MLVNSNYRYGGGGIGSSLIIEGYYNDSKFYEDESFTTEIDGKSGIIYVDILTNKAYRWDGSIFTAFNSDNAEFATNADAVGGINVSNFIYPRGYFTANVDDIKYPFCGLVVNTTDGVPTTSVWGTLMCYAGGTGSFVQLWVSADDNATMFKRHFDGNMWSEWKRSCDDGNADTVDGLHASDFANIIDLGGNQTDTKTATGQSGKTTIYRCVNWIGYPSAAADSQGTIIAVNYSGAGTAEINQMWIMQIFISAHGTPIFIRWIANMSVGEWQPILTATGGTMTGALVAQSNTAYSTPQVRNATMSTSAPSGGSNGQIHYKYS